MNGQPPAKALSSLAPTRNRSRVSPKTSAALWTEEEDSLLMEIMQKSPENIGEFCQFFKSKTQQQIVDRWNKVMNPELVKGSWTLEEDKAITQWVAEHGAQNWSNLAVTLPGRLGKQCRERWVNSLNPDLLRKPWTDEEDNTIIQLQESMGNRWSKIAAALPGRTDNSVKNRWNSTLKRRLERAANGEPLFMKRGRRPKRLSNAPDIAPPSSAKSMITIRKIEDIKNEEIHHEEEEANIKNPRQTEIPKPDFNVVDLSLPSPAGTQTPLLMSPFLQMSPTMMKDNSFFPLWSPINCNDMKGMLFKNPLPFSLEQNDGSDSKCLDSSTSQQ